jgi:hypothetical protein
MMYAGPTQTYMPVVLCPGEQTRAVFRCVCAPEKQTEKEPFAAMDSREASEMCAATAADSSGTLSVTVIKGLLHFCICEKKLCTVPWQSHEGRGYLDYYERRVASWDRSGQVRCANEEDPMDRGL